MFELKDYINIDINNYYSKYNDYDNKYKTVTIPISVNEEKIKADTRELKKVLRNLRKIFNKDYTIVVTKDKVQIMTDINE